MYREYHKYRQWRGQRDWEKTGREKKLEGEREKMKQEKTGHKLLYKVLHSENRCSASHRILPTPIIVSRVNARPGVLLQDTFSQISVERFRWSNIVPSLLKGGGKRNLSPRGNNSSPFRIFVVFSDDPSRAKDRHEKTNQRTNERKKGRKKERKEGKKRRKETGQKRITFRRRTKCHSSEKFPWKSSIPSLVLWRSVSSGIEGDDFNIRLELMSAPN